jgi:uncharacterized protein (TIGR00369 family)
MHDGDAPRDSTNGTPNGFVPILSPGPFLAESVHVFRHAELTHLYGMRVERRHLNPTLIAHGGVLATFADTALGNAGVHASGHVCYTANLSIDYLAPAHSGDWIVAEVDVSKSGKRLLFAECRVSCADRRILRASAVFVLGPSWTWPSPDADEPNPEQAR